MKKLSLFIFFFASMLLSLNAISKEDSVSNLVEKSIGQKLVNTFGANLTTESTDIKMKYKAGKGLELSLIHI